MHAHYLQHVSIESPGSITTWLERHNYHISHTFCDQVGIVFPPVDEVDFLLVLGGPMSATDEENYPWLRQEKDFIRAVIQRNKPVLGICLGAQLVAEIMGGEIRHNDSREIGWWPVKAVNRDPDQGFVFPEEFRAFHWHGETFSLPDNAVHLARSKACENQAFQIGPQVMGLQFHLETLPQIASDLVRHCRHELVPADYVQSDNEILGVDASRYFDINQLMNQLLDYLTRNSQ